MLWHRNIILDRYETFINTNYLFNAKSMLIYDYRRTEVFADNKVRAALSTIKYSNNLKKKLIEDVIMRSFKADDMGNIKLQKTLNSVIREESCMYINKDLLSMNTSALLKTAFKVYSNFLFQNNFYKLNLQNVNPLRYNKNVYKVFTKKLEILPYYFFNDDTGMRSAKLFVVQYKHKNKYKNYNRHFLTIQQQPVSIWNLSKTMNIIEYENLNYNDTKALSFNR